MTAHTLPIGILTGPTATGKSGLALQFARKHPQIELINADSLLVYRGLNIGAAKPTPTELQEVPHHLVDIRNPDESFTAGEFLRAAQEAIRSISERGKRPLIVGGTGFYLQALLYGIWEAPSADPRTRTLLEEKSNSILHQELLSIDPPSALRIGLSDRYRLIRALEIIKLSGQTPTELQAKTPRQADPRFHLWVLDRSNEELQERIQHRTRAMLRQNFIAEVQALRDQFPHCRPLQAVG